MREPETVEREERDVKDTPWAFENCAIWVGYGPVVRPPGYPWWRRVLDFIW